MGRVVSSKVDPRARALVWALTAVAAVCARPGGAWAAGPAVEDPIPPLFAQVEGSRGGRHQEAELTLAAALMRARLPVVATSYLADVLKQDPGGAYGRSALEGLMEAQNQLKDEYLIPSLLATQETPAWASLPVETRARAELLLAMVDQRKDAPDQARARLLTIPRESAVYAKAQYLLGVVLSDPRLSGGPRNEAALGAFERVVGIKDAHQEDLSNTQALARLGIARALYDLGRYSAAAAAYDEVPRFSQYWDQALFENGYARFRMGDLGGALGSLQALHAPQFEGAFLPESWILKGTIYFFSCLYEESKGALTAFDRVYSPMIDQLRPWATGGARDLREYAAAVQDERGSPLPRPVLVWIRSNERLAGLMRMSAEASRERQRIDASERLRGTAAAPGLTAVLEGTQGTLTQVVGELTRKRISEAYRNLKSFSDQAEIIKFETTKAEKELVEAGVDQAALLAHQRIHRPRSPGSNWDYWKFDGEFWIDEIGYYQYTLKNGCPRAPSVPGAAP